MPAFVSIFLNSYKIRELVSNINNTLIAVFFILFIFSSSFVLPLYDVAEAHFDHLAHYNSSGLGVGNKYYVLQQIDPEYVKPGELAKIQFSIQDKNGRDTQNIVVMVEIYSSLTGERISVFPWTDLEVGDFEIPYVFPDKGNYQIVLSILNDYVSSSSVLNTIPEPRTILNDSLRCDCERAVFNVSINTTFGSVFVSVIYIAVFGAVISLGAVLSWMYLSRRKSKSNPITNDEFIKYSVLFLAMGASIVHLAVYPEHAALRLEYSIFLISASGAQLVYGIMYVLLIFSDDNLAIKKSNKNYVSKEYYKKSVILNLFGLVGSLVLIFLYLYSVIFPPPLSPNDYPEDVDLAGIIDKSLEIILVIGIIYLMRSEKKRYLRSINSKNSENIM